MSGPPDGTEVVANGASAAAVAKAADILDRVFGSLAPENARRLKQVKLRLNVIPEGVKLTELPDYAHLKGVKTFESTEESPRYFDDLRGVGGAQVGDVVHYALGDEQLTGGPDGSFGGYGAHHVAFHESGHVVHEFALTDAQQQEVERLWKVRKEDPSKSWLEPSAYTSANPHEYFANSVAAFFGAPLSTNADVQAMYTPDWLREHDPAMYDLLTQVFAGAGYSALDDLGHRLTEPDTASDGPSLDWRKILAGAAAITLVVGGAVGGTILARSDGGEGPAGTEDTSVASFYVPSVIDPSELTEDLPVVSVPSTIVTDPSTLGLPGPIQRVYEEYGLLLRQTDFLFHDGLDPSNEDAWPDKVEGSFNWGVSYFPTHDGAAAVAQASMANLEAQGFEQLAGRKFAPGDVAVFEPASPDTNRVNQIWYWVRGNAFIAIAGTGKFELRTVRPDQAVLFDALNQALHAEESASGGSLTKAAAADLYEGAAASVNEAANAFQERTQGWGPTTSNDQAVSDGVPLAGAFDRVEARLLTIAGRRRSARTEVWPVVAAVAALEADLTDLEHLDQIGVTAWLERYDADLGALTTAANELRSELGLPVTGV